MAIASGLLILEGTTLTLNTTTGQGGAVYRVKMGTVYRRKAEGRPDSLTLKGTTQGLMEERSTSTAMDLLV